jgi:hypothetical protein
MKSGNWVVSALQVLAEHDRECEAPGDVEVRLIQAFRRRRARKQFTVIALASLAAAAGIAVFFVPREASKPPAPEPVVAVAPPPAEAITPVPAQKRVRRPVRRLPREIVTQFFPLLDAAPPFERGELVRVTVPASTMRKVGLPVNEDRLEDRVYADVLVGQEGLARAIRFVSFEQ